MQTYQNLAPIEGAENMASFVALLMSLNAQELQCLHSDSELMRQLTETQLLMENRLQNISLQNKINALQQQHQISPNNYHDYLSQAVALSAAAAAATNQQQNQNQQQHQNQHLTQQQLLLQQQLQQQQQLAHLQQHHLHQKQLEHNNSIKSRPNHLVENESTQRMIIDEDDDENVYSNDVDMMIRQELIEAHSKSNSVKPGNLKKSFIKRYRKSSFHSNALFLNWKIFNYGKFIFPHLSFSLVPR